MNIHETIFENYQSLLDHTKQKHGVLFQSEDLVNEAIVQTLDVSIEFTDKEHLLSFVKESIKVAFYREKSFKEDRNFYTKNKGGEEYTKVDKNPVDNFKNIFEVFEIARFGLKNENKICLKCGSKRFYTVNSNQKCSTCGHQMSLRSGTYLSHSKFPFKKLFLMVKTICQDPKVSSAYLARYCECTQKTAYYRSLLIKSAIKTVKTTEVRWVLAKILTPVKLDKKPIRVKKPKPKFTPQDIANIIRCRMNKVYNCKELAKMYKTDSSTISKIARGVAYNKRAENNSAFLKIINTFGGL